MTIAALVDRERRSLRRTELLAGLLLGAGATALLLAAGAMLLGHARWLTLPRALPFGVWILIGGALVLLGVRTRRRLGARGSRRDVALAIETERGMRRGLLLGAIELEGAGALAGRAAQAARANLPDGSPLAPELRRASSRRALVGGGVAAAGVLVLLSATPLFADGLRAVLRPIDAWRGALLERPRIEGAPRDLVRGAELRVTVRAPGRRTVELSSRQVGEAWRTDTLVVDPRTGTAAWRLEALRGDLRLLASDGRAVSDSVIVHAADRPFLGAITLHVVYPSYLSRASESLPVGEPLRLPRGSTLSIAGRASVPLDAVTLTTAGGESYALGTAAQSFSGRLAANHSMQLRWLARGPGGPVADVPPPLELEVLADSAPRVTIASPTVDTLIANDDRAELSLTATDDHGIGTVVLRLTRIAGRQDGPGAIQPVAERVGTSWTGGGTVDLTALRLGPGEMVRVRAEAVDASPWVQRGVSRDLIIKRPTMEERRDVARALGDSAVKEARAVAAGQKALAQRTDEAARAQSRQGTPKSGSEPSSAGNPAERSRSMSFENAEKARGLAQEQRAMAERVEKLRQATKQLEEQLKAAGALDTSLARQLNEAQALLRQALTPEMMSQMQKLENAAKQMNGDQSRDALRDLAQMQQRMKEQLERSAEMLKRAAHEGAMQTLGDQAKELAQKERALADSARSSATATEKDARESARLAEQARRLREQMEGLKERLAKDRAEAGASNTAQAGEHAAKSETGMRRAANEMQKSGSPTGEQNANAAQQARDAASEMEQASRSMQDARAAQVKEWKKELTSELDQAVQEMMQLAREERALEQKARGGSPSGDQRGAQSAVEQGVDKAAERLQSAGRKSALLSPRSQRAVGEAKDKVTRATQKVSQPTGSSAQQAGALGEAADALTRAAAALARDRERANSANSASGFSEMMKEMQEMAQKQGQINAQAQGLMGMPGGSPSAQSLARALAQKQRGVADQLEDAGDAAGGDRAAQLAREARQLADQLDGGRLDAGTLARQQQLFRKLLDAGRSLEKEEREDSGKREATSATGNDTFSPTGRAEGKAAARFRPPTWEELRGLSSEERRAILDYFTRLNSGPAPQR
jgi:hypothetical protein